jgi:hypothetical protein
MWTDPFDRQDEQEIEAGTIATGAFVAVPAMMGATTCQQQLYHWAYDQAKQSIQICRPARMQDLFAVMN